MEGFLGLVNKLPNDQRDIFYKYMGAIAACHDDLEEKIEFLESNQIKLNTAKALVRFFSMDMKDIKTRYKLYQQAGLSDLVVIYPEILRYHPSKVISRIKACEKAGKAFMVNGKPADYLFDDEQWDRVKSIIISEENEYYNDSERFEKKPDFNSSEWLNQKDYIPDEAYDIDVITYERYERLSKVLANIRTALGSSSYNASNRLISDEYLIREIGTNPDKSDKEIIKDCLKALDEHYESADDIIDEFLYYDVSKEEKRGL